MLRDLSEKAIHYLSKEDLKNEYSTLLGNYDAVVAERNMVCEELSQLKKNIPDTNMYKLEFAGSRMISKYDSIDWVDIKIVEASNKKELESIISGYEYNHQDKACKLKDVVRL